MEDGERFIRGPTQPRIYCRSHADCVRWWRCVDPLGTCVPHAGRCGDPGSLKDCCVFTLGKLPRYGRWQNPAVTRIFMGKFMRHRGRTFTSCYQLEAALFGMFAFA